MKTYNTSPYYDDYSEDKKYYQILFNPSRAVQARELTQLQTILRNQIERFGNHIFKHGSVVIPGNSVSDLNVPYVKIAKEHNGISFNEFDLEGSTLVGELSGVEAIVRKVVEDSEFVILYLNYTKGSGGLQSNEFQAGEELTLKTIPSIVLKVVDEDATGIGALAFINQGVYYVNGCFALVTPQSVVLSKFDNKPSCHVLLEIEEQIVTSLEDETLLDPAQGSYNYTAPGADRLHINLKLTTLDLDAEITEDYVEIMRYRNGVLEEHSKTPRYSELEKSLARRTYDESGNYLIEGFGHKLREHKKTPYNNGLSVDGDRNKFVVEIEPGRGYIEGLETTSIYTQRVVLDKARTEEHIKTRTTNIKSSYGKFLFVSDLKQLPDFRSRQLVDLYNTSDTQDGSATKVGTARVIAIDYQSGDAESDNAIYKLYIDSVSLTAPHTIQDVGGIRFGVGGSASVLTKYRAQNATVDFQVGETVSNVNSGRSGTVVRYSRNNGELYLRRDDSSKKLPNIGDLVNGSVSEASVTLSALETMGGLSNPPIFEIPVSPLATIRNEDGVYDIQYTVWKNITLTTDGSGYAQFTVAEGNIVPIEAGTIVAVEPTKIVTRDKISINNNNQLIINGATPNTTINVLCQVTKVGAAPKTKTLATHTLTNVAPSRIISLQKADIVRVIQVTTVSGVDVTASFSLDNGQTDYYYGIGRLIQIGQLPSENLNIVFEYFEHNGTGDYFSIDSYVSLGDEYVATAPTYRSITSGSDYPLGNCLDFRPRVGSSGNFETGSPSLVDMPVIDTFITTSAQYYIPRVDVVALTKNGSIVVLKGTPKENPKAQKVPENMIGLCLMYIPAYTATLSDIEAFSMRNYRYTMKDIKGIEERLLSVESLSLLNSLESEAVNTEVIDPNTGLVKFKSGYLVDNFTGYAGIRDVFNPLDSCQTYQGKLTPVNDVVEAEYTLLDTSVNVQNTGGQLTLPYREVAFIEQDVSTRTTNLNPFMVINYEGVMVLDPPFDIWTDVRELDTIYRTENKTVTVTKRVTRPCPTPPKSSSSSNKATKPTYAELRPDVVAAYEAQKASGGAMISAYDGKPITNLSSFILSHLTSYGVKEGMLGQYSTYV